jgi:peptidoglycan hydrolase-like protein with peptidoglycan-binding domain
MVRQKKFNLGEENSSVIYLQRLLNLVGYTLSVDGRYGVHTQSAVLDFQQRNQLQLNENVGEATLELLLMKKRYVQVLNRKRRKIN